MPKILIIRFSSIGDIVLTSPIVRCVKTQIAGAEIHFLTKKANALLVENNPYIDRCFFLEENLQQILPALNAEQYDWVIDLHNNIRSQQVSWNLGLESIRFNKLNLRKWLLVNFKIDRLPKIHIIDRYFAAIAHLGVVNDRKGLEYFIPENERVLISELPLTHQNGYIGFVIGANYCTKRLPIEKINSICKKLNQPTILLGGKNEEILGNQLREASPELIFNACGKYSLSQSASLIEQSRLVVSHDTGLMHIAAAFNKRIVSIWGNTVPAFGMTPYVDPLRFFISEVKGLSCRPCSKIGFHKCPKGHFKCMNLIDESEILSIVKGWWKEIN